MPLEPLEAGLRQRGIGYSIKPSFLPLLSDIVTEGGVRFTFRVGFEDDLDEEFERLGLQSFVVTNNKWWRDEWWRDAHQ